MKNVFNQFTTNHFSFISNELKTATDISVAVAFLKLSGWSQLEKQIKKSLERKCRIKIFCGLNFGITEADALIRIKELFDNYPHAKLYMVYTKGKQVFHPKLWAFTQKQKVNVLCGSANFTGGGLENNFECSIATELNSDSPEAKKIEQYFEWLIAKGFAKEATHISISQYSAYQKVESKKQVGIKASPPPPEEINHNYEKLIKWFERLKIKEDFQSTHRERRKEYVNAKNVLDKIATGTSSKEIFADYYQQLVGSTEYNPHWKSGSIDRGKQKVINHWRKFVQLVRFIKSNQDADASFVYEGSKKIASGIMGVGPNIIGEIMMTFNPDDFANINRNPITVLLDETNVNIWKSSSSYSGDDYANYCNLIKEIRTDLKLKDMLEMDTFFNEIYWEIKNRKSNAKSIRTV